MDEEGRFWKAAFMKLLNERMKNAQIRRKAADAANRKRWLKKFGLENLPKALRRAAFFCNFESEDSPEVDIPPGQGAAD